ncbi:MAG: hypothetical protein PVF22_06640, partial [Candidatus Aminicenantes bacterium]
MNRIKKLLWISLIAAALCYPALSKDLAVNSVWTTATLNIDGDSEDWGDDVFNTEDKLSIDLAFRNDNDFLYILFMFKDPQFMSSIGETGLTVYFNADGKRRKHDGLRFVRQLVSADQFIDILERQRGALTEEQKQEVRLRKSYSIRRYKIIEKKDELDIPTDVEQVQRAIFRTETDKAAKTAVYEIAIPLDKAADKATGIGTEPGQAIKIGFEWGGLTPERREMLMKKIAGDQGVAARSRDASRSNIKSERNRV